MLARMGAKAEELMDDVLALPEQDRREFARELLVKLAIESEVLRPGTTKPNGAGPRSSAARSKRCPGMTCDSACSAPAETPCRFERGEPREPVVRGHYRQERLLHEHRPLGLNQVARAPLDRDGQSPAYSASLQ